MNPTVIPDDLIETFRRARRIVVVTGAGTSAESGIPTFRDAQTGLWARYRPEDLATPEAFRKDPGLVWRWYRWRRDKVLAAAPNPGHYAIAQMQAHKAFSEFLVVTQNVDGLHQAAGSHPVVELHGSILRTRCFAGGHRQDSWPDSPESVEYPPQCPQCKSLLRPDVVWFNPRLLLSSIFDSVAVARPHSVTN
jgi:NAD-dependent deacetylase